MDPTVVAAWIAAGASILTLLGTLAAQYFGYRASGRDAEKTATEQREQLDRTFTEQREQLAQTLGEQRTRTLNERFATAAEQLGGNKPPQVRLAGVYAMAGLADDWAENRQICVEVLCAYLRMPYSPDPGPDADEEKRLAFLSNREVRHTIIRLITAHLRDGAAVSWQGLNLDFTGAVFDGGSFNQAQFSGGDVSFENAVFSGLVDFSCAEFIRGSVDFSHAKFSSGTVSFFSAEFSGGFIDFTEGAFFVGMVDFKNAKFSGSDVNFSNPVDWSIPPRFPWSGRPPQGVTLPAKKDESARFPRTVDPSD